MHYRMRKEKIYTTTPCNQLLIVANHIVIAQERKLMLCNFSCGDARRKEREWNFDSDIKFIRTNGGPAGREGLLLGMADGRVLKTYVDNPFPIQLLHASGFEIPKCAH